MDTRNPTNGDIWMIANAASGSHDSEAIVSIASLFRNAGRRISRIIQIGEGPLPTGAEAMSAGIGLVIIFGGDGTITSATDALAGWDGDILVLPGGTMNLLAKALHDDMSALEIAALAAGGEMHAAPIPIISGAGQCALAGIIAGPTSAWGDVREDARNMDIGALASSIPGALADTLSGQDIAVDGIDGRYQAVYLQPADTGIAVRGVLARGPGELIRHGWAWLAGDFRDGPSDDLGIRDSVTIRGDEPIGLLVDGEKARGAPVLSFERRLSSHRYVSCRGGICWS